MSRRLSSFAERGGEIKKKKEERRKQKAESRKK
jgi:hypothetical protein